MAPDGARGGPLWILQVDNLIANLRAQRRPPLLERQEDDARALARDSLAQGWDPSEVLAGLLRCDTFTAIGFDLGVGDAKKVAKKRLNPYQRSRLGL